jgi:hypothetical protein
MGTMKIHPALALAAALGLAGASCRAPAPAPAAPVECSEPEGQLAPGARADALVGDYRLTLSATEGPRTGTTIAGTLRLRAYGSRPAPLTVPPGMEVRYPLYGGTDLDPAEVGGMTWGEVAPLEAARPGVLVLEWRRDGAPVGANEITMRLGAEANSDDRQRFDGAYFSLFVKAVSDTRFTGLWTSRTGDGTTAASGFFCADRVAAR